MKYPRLTTAYLMPIFALGLAASLPIAASAQTILFGSVADFAPYNFLSEEGEVDGFEAELADLICTYAGLECDWVLSPWEEIITDLQQGDMDVIMTGMQITDEREVLIDFSQEYFPSDPSAVLVMAGGAMPGGGSVVGAQVDTLQASYVTDSGWTLSGFATTEDAIYAMLGGQVNAVVADQAYLESFLLDNPDIYELAATNVTIGGGIGLGVRDSDTSLKATLNTALSALKASGALDDLIGTWFEGRDPNYRGDEG